MKKSILSLLAAATAALSLAACGQGPTAGQAAGAKEGEVVDAEFEDLGEKK